MSHPATAEPPQTLDRLSSAWERVKGAGRTILDHQAIGSATKKIEELAHHRAEGNIPHEMALMALSVLFKHEDAHELYGTAITKQIVERDARIYHEALIRALPHHLSQGTGDAYLRGVKAFTEIVAVTPPLFHACLQAIRKMERVHSWGDNDNHPRHLLERLCPPVAHERPAP